MQRRHFIKALGWISGGLLLSDQLAAFAQPGVKKIRGRVTANGKGIKGVVVSDGYTVIVTGDNGRYELVLHPASLAVFISTPAGYAFKNERNLVRQYHSINTIKKTADFELKPLDKDDTQHQFIIWADPQVKNDKDVEKMMKESVPDVQKWVAGAGAGTLLHGITVGDIVWDEHKYFPSYDEAVNKMGIPFFQCLGNHDMDYNNGGDETSDLSFQKAYGPTYYSFNRGKVHYVVMDNVRYLGKDREYDGFFQQHQLDWLQKDLSFVAKEQLIILCVHIPVHNGVKNNQALYELLRERKVHIMSGHTHYHRNVIKENIYEHNHGTVCGAWWTGPICGDGTPCGYGVYKVNGTELEWHYQATGQPVDYQLKIFVNDLTESSKEVQVNIWNYDPAWQTEYWADGVHKGALVQFDGFDPKAYATLLGPELPKARGFAEPRKTEHLFKGVVAASTKEIKVVATDRFGKKYTSTYTV